MAWANTAMRWLMVALLVLVAGTAASRADDAVPDADREAIQQVIRDQMAAFKRDDAAAAFSYAAPTIKHMFADDPERFMTMVRQGYQPVYRPRRAAFGTIAMVEGQVVQRVQVEGPDGTERTALYNMEHEADGTWRISGCSLTEAGSAGA